MIEDETAHPGWVKVQAGDAGEGFLATGLLQSKDAPPPVATESASPSAGVREGVYRVGGGVTPPQLVYRVEPEYTDEARSFKHEGVVVLYAVVGPDGKVRDIKVTRPLGLGLDEKAMDAVRQWQFRPGVKEGRPVAVAASVEVTFRLLHAPSSDFPLRVYVLETSVASGTGKGNVVDKASMKGFDFTSTCPVPVLAGRGVMYYRGKWEKKETELVILVAQIGKFGLSKCELRTSMAAAPYALTEGRATASVPK